MDELVLLVVGVGVGADVVLNVVVWVALPVGPKPVCRIRSVGDGAVRSAAFLTMIGVALMRCGSSTHSRRAIPCHRDSWKAIATDDVLVTMV